MDGQRFLSTWFYRAGVGMWVRFCMMKALGVVVLGTCVLMCWCSGTLAVIDHGMHLRWGRIMSYLGLCYR